MDLGYLKLCCMWLGMDSILDWIRTNLTTLEVELACQLCSLLSALQTWHENKFGKVFHWKIGQPRYLPRDSRRSTLSTAATIDLAAEIVFLEKKSTDF